jgi:hypothetical protein
MVMLVMATSFSSCRSPPSTHIIIVISIGVI